MPEPVITEGQAEHEPALRLKNPVSSVCERRAPLQFPATDLVRGDTIASNLDAFADVSRILVKRILDMQEAIDFYELNLFEALKQENDSNPEVRQLEL
jgi:hypothetical protein